MRHVKEGDIEAVRALVQEAGVFSPVEIAVAAELVEEAVHDPAAYQFLLLKDKEGSFVGYTCYGEIPLTDKRFDLFWIVVSPHWQRQRLGNVLLTETERLVMGLGGRYLYAETSGQLSYLPARQFYERSGFTLAARFTDFYKDGDDKYVYQKKLPRLNPAQGRSPEQEQV